MLWLEILLLVGIIAYSAKLGGIGVGMAPMPPSLAL